MPQLSTEERNACPQEAWKPIITASLDAEDAAAAARGAQAALYNKFHARFNVVCVPRATAGATTALAPVDAIAAATASPAAFVANGDGYCAASNEKHWCQATILYA